MSTKRVERKWKEGISSSIKYTILESFKDITATNEISKILNDVMKKRTGLQRWVKECYSKHNNSNYEDLAEH